MMLPIARPAVAVGLSLVLMETLNDFGTVDFFAVQTLTAGLFDTWMNLGNLGGAAQIATTMLMFVEQPRGKGLDRKSTRLNSSHVRISYAVFCLKKKKKTT